LERIRPGATCGRRPLVAIAVLVVRDRTAVSRELVNLQDSHVCQIIAISGTRERQTEQHEIVGLHDLVIEDRI
jgi:hypothetical protein